jgi:hypothetical protein
MREVDRCAKLGLRVVFIDRAARRAATSTTSRMYPLYEKVLEHDMDAFPQTSGPWGGKSIDYAHPRPYRQVAEDFRRCRIIAGHACYPYVREAIIVAARHENVFFPRTCICADGHRRLGEVAEQQLLRAARSILVATCFPSIPIKPFVRRVLDAADQGGGAAENLYKNALRVFKLEDDPVFKSMYPGLNRSST